MGSGGLIGRLYRRNRRRVCREFKRHDGTDKWHKVGGGKRVWWYEGDTQCVIVFLVCYSICCQRQLLQCVAREQKSVCGNASKRAKSILHAFKSPSQSSGSSKKIPISLSAVVHQQMRKVKGILHMQPNCRIASTIADTATLRAAHSVTPCRVLPGPSGHGVSCPIKKSKSRPKTF